MTSAVDCAYQVNGSGPVLFLVHGVGARGASWEKVVERLSSRCTCVSYDLRGHGDSPKPQQPITLEALVADLERLRERLGIKRAHVFGHSLGGMIAPAYAHAHPTRVRSIGLLSTAAFRSDEDASRVQGIAATIREQGPAKLVDGFVSRWFTEDFLKARPEAVELRKKQVLATDPKVFAEVFTLYSETEMAPWLQEVEVPALVLTGEQDLTCNPRLNKLMAAALPKSQLVILDKLKHGLVVESPERVAQAIGQFLDGLNS